MSPEDKDTTKEVKEEVGIKSDTTSAIEDEKEEVTKKPKSRLSAPGAILIAGAMISLSVLAGNMLPTGPAPASQARVANSGVARTASAESAPQILASDHALGAENAALTIVEYSDIQCPFCARFHTTMETIIADNPEKVRWVYRHLPLDSHPQAYSAAAASECLARLSGEDAFWSGLSQMMADARTLGPDYFSQLATDFGISQIDFQTCLNDPSVSEVIDSHIAQAASFGGSGTPFSVFILPDGSWQPVPGALPLDTMQALVDQI